MGRQRYTLTSYLFTVGTERWAVENVAGCVWNLGWSTRSYLIDVNYKLLFSFFLIWILQKNTLKMNNTRQERLSSDDKVPNQINFRVEPPGCWARLTSPHIPFPDCFLPLKHAGVSDSPRPVSDRRKRMQDLSPVFKINPSIFQCELVLFEAFSAFHKLSQISPYLWTPFLGNVKFSPAISIIL